MGTSSCSLPSGAIADVLRMQVAGGKGWQSLSPRLLAEVVSAVVRTEDPMERAEIIRHATLLMAEAIEAAWVLWARILRSCDCEMPFDLTDPTEEVLVERVLRALASCYSGTEASHMGSDRLGMMRTGFVGAVFGEVGRVVLGQAPLQKLVVPRETRIIEIPGHRLQRLVEGEVRIEEAVARWRLWRRTACLNRFQLVAPWPFDFGELQMLVGHKAFPELTREEIMVACLNDVMFGNLAWSARPRDERHLSALIDVALACALGMPPGRAQLARSCVEEGALAVKIAAEAMKTVLNDSALPKRSFVNLPGRGRNGPETAEIPQDGFGSDSPEESGRSQRHRGEARSLPTPSRVLAAIERALAKHAVDRGRLPPRLEKARSSRSPAGADDVFGVETALIGYDEGWFAAEAAAFADVSTGTLARWIRERKARGPRKFLTGRKGSSFAVFTKPEMMGLWLRGASGEAFSAVLGMPVRKLRRKLELVNRMLPGLDPGDVRMALLRTRGRWPEQRTTDVRAGSPALEA